jgi:hypothetical protein
MTAPRIRVSEPTAAKALSHLVALGWSRRSPAAPGTRCSSIARLSSAR